MEHLSGRVTHRGCTDKKFFFLFLILCGGQGYILYRAFTEGDPYRIVHGIDTWGNTCHRNNTPVEGAKYSGMNVSGLSNLFWFSFNDTVNSTRICIRDCPNVTILNTHHLREWALERDIHLCRYDVDNRKLIPCPGLCPDVPVVASTSVVNRCIPNYLYNPDDNPLGLKSVELTAIRTRCNIAGTFFQRIASDINEVWDIMSLLGALGLLFSFLLMMALRHFTGFMTHLILLIGSMGSILSCFYAWNKMVYHVKQYELLHKDHRMPEEWLRILLWLFLSLLQSFIMTSCLYIAHHMSKNMMPIQETIAEVDAILPAMPFLLFQPIITSLFIIIILKLTVVGYIYMHTAVVYNVKEEEYVTTVIPDWVKTWRWFHFIIMFWLVHVVQATQEFVIASTVSHYYFCRKKSVAPANVFKGIWRALRFHLGSIIMATLLIAIGQKVKFAIYYSYKMLSHDKNPFSRVCLECLDCFIGCYDHLLRYIDKSAFAVTAIYGYGYVEAVSEIVHLSEYHPYKYEIIKESSGFFLFLTESGLSGLVFVVAIALLEKHTEVCFVFGPVLLVTILTYQLAHCFISIYTMAMDTLLVCYAIDHKENDGKNKPYLNAAKVKFFMYDVPSEDAESVQTRMHHLMPKPKVTTDLGIVDLERV